MGSSLKGTHQQEASRSIDLMKGKVELQSSRLFPFIELWSPLLWLFVFSFFTWMQETRESLCTDNFVDKFTKDKEMPSSFFLPKGSKKRRAPPQGSVKGTKKKRFQLGGKGGKFKTNEKEVEATKPTLDDEEILSEGSDIDGDPDVGYLSSDHEEEVETAEEKRLRLAKLYLEEIEKVENIFYLLARFSLAKSRYFIEFQISKQASM